MTGVDDYMPIIRATRGKIQWSCAKVSPSPVREVVEQRLTSERAGLLCGRGGGTYSGAGSASCAGCICSPRPTRRASTRCMESRWSWWATALSPKHSSRSCCLLDVWSRRTILLRSRVGKGRCRGVGMSTHGHNDASVQQRHVDPTAPRCAVGQCGEGRVVHTPALISAIRSGLKAAVDVLDQSELDTQQKEEMQRLVGEGNLLSRRTRLYPCVSSPRCSARGSGRI